MEEIKVGEYVRTKKGYIAKFIYVNNTLGVLEFDKTPHVYIAPHNTKNEKHVKELHTYIKNTLSSYHISNFDFAIWT